MSENESHSKKPKKKHPIRRWGSRLLKLCLGLIILFCVGIVIALVAINAYLASNDTKIFSQIDFLNDGMLAFDEAKISVFRDFPAATLSLNNVVLQDSLYEEHGIPFLKLNKLSAALSLRQMWDRKIEIQRLRLEEGALNIFTDECGYSNVKSLFSKQNKDKVKDDGLQKAGFARGLEVLADQLKVKLTDIEFHFREVNKGTNIAAFIDQTSAKILELEDRWRAKLDLDLLMHQMAFKEETGAFLQDSQLSGKAILDLKDETLSFKPFTLRVNDEKILFSGNYHLKKDSISTLTLENKNTSYENTLPLLSEQIRKQLTQYDIKGRFPTKTSISGYFKAGEPPLIAVEFALKKQDVRVTKYGLSDVSLSGRFINRLYEADDSRSKFEPKKSVRLELASITGAYKDFDISSPHMLITSEGGKEARLTAPAKITGNAAGISEFLDSDEFVFEEGSFDLEAQLDGPISNFNAFLVDTDADLRLRDFSVRYVPAKVSIPFDGLDLHKVAGSAELLLTGSTLNENHKFSLKGDIDELPTILLKEVKENAKSNIAFRANKLGWQDFLDLFGDEGYFQFEKDTITPNSQKIQTMKETVRGIQRNFQPRLSIQVDTMTYYDRLVIHNMKTSLYFKDENTIVLEETSFEYGDGKLEVNATLDISDPLKTAFDYDLTAERVNLAELLPPFNYFNVELLSSFTAYPEDVYLHINHNGLLDDEEGLIPNTSTGEIIFKMDEGRSLAGRITYEQDDSPETKAVYSKSFVNTTLELEGDPALFNTFFYSDQFFFQKGRFYTTFDYLGDVATLEELLQKSEANFLMKDCELYYYPADVSFPFSEVELDVKADAADFEISLKMDSLEHAIVLEGELDHLSELLIGETGNEVNTDVLIHMNELNWSDFLSLFTPEDLNESSAFEYLEEIRNGLVDTTKEKEVVDKEVRFSAIDYLLIEDSLINVLEPSYQEDVLIAQDLRFKNLKTTILGVLNNFNPSIQLRLGAFIFSDKLQFENIETGMHMEGANTVVLDKTGFTFRDGLVQMHSQIDLNDETDFPFQARFQAEDLDVAALLESLNYLNMPPLQTIEELSGRISMDLELESVLSIEQGLVPELTRGRLDFDIRNVALKGLAPLDSVASKVMLKNRFDDLRLAPLTSVIYIDGLNLIMPMIEIQSNAFNIFVEGVISYAYDTNVWISIPIDNLKSPDKYVLPEKRGYARAKQKVFVEVTMDENRESQFKFHLSKKKFYKTQGILEHFKLDRKKYRKERKHHRKHHGALSNPPVPVE